MDFGGASDWEYTSICHWTMVFCIAITYFLLIGMIDFYLVVSLNKLGKLQLMLPFSLESYP